MNYQKKILLGTTKMMIYPKVHPYVSGEKNIKPTITNQSTMVIPDYRGKKGKRNQSNDRDYHR